MGLKDWLLDLLFPPKCPVCGKIQDASGICPACWNGLSRTEGPEQEQILPDGSRCAAPLWYEDLVRDCFLRLKFGGVIGAAGELGGLVADCAAEHFDGEFDLVTWVPVSRRRLRKRGYDQTQLLAEAACRSWGIRPVRLLRKTVHNRAQSGLENADARRSNVHGVYRADSAAVRGRRVLLIDDIVTTGSTLSECAKVLREAGAESVVCAAAARTRHGGAVKSDRKPEEAPAVFCGKE